MIVAKTDAYVVKISACSSPGFRGWGSAADGFPLLSTVPDFGLEFRAEKLSRESLQVKERSCSHILLAVWKLQTYSRLISLKMSLESGPVVPELLQTVVNLEKMNSC